LLLSSPFFLEGIGWYHPIIAKNGDFCITNLAQLSIVTAAPIRDYACQRRHSVIDVGWHLVALPAVPEPGGAFGRFSKSATYQSASWTPQNPIQRSQTTGD
jgi:hypothetical protein